MERVASVTSSYYKFAEAAILVFALDNLPSFHALSQHMLDIVSYAENAKIFLCGNKMDLEGTNPQVEFHRLKETNKFKFKKNLFCLGDRSRYGRLLRTMSVADQCFL